MPKNRLLKIGSIFFGINLFPLLVFGQTKPLKVLVFLQTECPISQKVTLSLNEIKRQFSDQPLEWTAYFTDKKLSKKEIQNFKKQYQFTWKSERDKRLRHAQKYKATITPEVFLLSATDEILYHGALDNWFYEWGKNRLKPTEFYLEDAIKATLKGESVIKKYEPAIGCWLEY